MQMAFGLQIQKSGGYGLSQLEGMRSDAQVQLGFQF
jgi:hypothetical protein